jgi:general secretion pathway protein L
LRLRLQRGAEIRDLGNVPLLDGFEAPHGSPGERARARLSDLPRWLLLPAGSALRRRLPLPAAAANRLRDVVGFEIERQTPFAARRRGLRRPA